MILLFIVIGLAAGVLSGLFGIGGARLAQHMSPVMMKRAFSIFLVLVAANMWTSA